MKEERGVANTKGCLTLSTVLKCVDKCRSNEDSGGQTVQTLFLVWP